MIQIIVVNILDFQVGMCVTHLHDGDLVDSIVATQPDGHGFDSQVDQSRSFFCVVMIFPVSKGILDYFSITCIPLMMYCSS